MRSAWWRAVRIILPTRQLKAAAYAEGEVRTQAVQYAVRTRSEKKVQQYEGRWETCKSRASLGAKSSRHILGNCMQAQILCGSKLTMRMAHARKVHQGGTSIRASKPASVRACSRQCRCTRVASALALMPKRRSSASRDSRTSFSASAAGAPACARGPACAAAHAPGCAFSASAAGAPACARGAACAAAHAPGCARSPLPCAAAAAWLELAPLCAPAAVLAGLPAAAQPAPEREYVCWRLLPADVPPAEHAAPPRSAGSAGAGWRRAALAALAAALAARKHPA